MLNSHIRRCPRATLNESRFTFALLKRRLDGEVPLGWVAEDVCILLGHSSVGSLPALTFKNNQLYELIQK